MTEAYGKGGGSCCTEVVETTQRVAVMEAKDSVNKWWVRSACAFIIFVIPFLWNKLDGIESAVGKVDTRLQVHIESAGAHGGEQREFPR